jgi:polyisoprenyl-phosphate glycosyltransferase
VAADRAHGPEARIKEGPPMPDMLKGDARVVSTTASVSNLWERRLIATIVVAMTIMAAIVAIPLFSRRVPINDDLGAFFLPIRAFYARCLTEGDRFDWMPQLFGGFFVSGEGQNGTYHPLHWLLYRWLPVDVAFETEIVLPFVIMPLGLVVFLRKQIGLTGACMGALLFTFSTRFTHHLISPPTTMILAHLPWILAAMCVVAERGEFSKRCLACVAIALLTASQALLGHPQTTWFCGLTEILFAVFLWIQYRPSWGAWLGMLGVQALGLSMAAVQILPTYSTLMNSMRAEPDLSFKMSFSLLPNAVVGVVAPYMHWGRTPNWLGIYFGAVPLMLVLWWITAHRAGVVGDADAATELPARWKAARRLSLFAVVLSGLTLWLAFGCYGKLYYLQTLLPIIGSFRAPARYTLLTQFGVMIVAAIAFARLIVFVRKGQKLPWKHLAFPWLAVAASIALAAWFTIRTGGEFAHRFQGEFYSGPLMLGIAAVALTAASRGRQVGLVLLVVVGAVDMGLFGLAHPGSAKPCWWKTPTLEEFVASRPAPPTPCPGRVYDGLVSMNQSWLNGCRLINGYVALEPVRQLDYQHVNTLRVAEVAWYRDMDFGRPPRTIPGAAPPIEGGWCKVPDPLPRARLINRAIVSSDPREDIKRIDVDTSVLVTRSLPLSHSPPGKAKLVSDRPGRITVETAAPDRQLLVLSECYNPGWRAYLDDQPVQVEQVNGDFFGCVVPAGSHCVRFEFAPRCLLAGKTISLLGLTLTGVLAGIGFYRRRLEARAEREEAGVGESPWPVSVPFHRSGLASELPEPSTIRGRDQKIIICVPVLNDWDCAALLLERIDQVMRRPQLAVSVLLVDDGSTEEAPDALVGRLQNIDNVEILKLRRNVGHQRAIALGLTYIYSERPCDAVIVMDADGEDSPDDLPRLLDGFELHQGQRVVFAQRARRSEELVFRVFYQFYKAVHRLLTGRIVEVGNFSIIPAAQLDRLVGVSELWNHYAASVFKARLPVDKVPIARGKRLCGQSKMNFASLAIHGLSAISVFGEQVNTRLLLGTGIAGGLTLLAATAAVGLRCITGVAIPDWAAYALGLLAIVCLNGLLLSLIFSVSILQSRSNTSFLPLRDYKYYISGVRKVATRLAIFPYQSDRRAAG